MCSKENRKKRIRVNIDKFEKFCSAEKENNGVVIGGENGDKSKLSLLLFFLFGGEIRAWLSANGKDQVKREMIADAGKWRRIAQAKSWIK